MPFTPNDLQNSPAGLNTASPAVRDAVAKALADAAATVSAVGFELDAPLGQVQGKSTQHGRIALHGGEDFEGVLNAVEAAGGSISRRGYEIDFGSSYIQAVTFDDQGPVAHAILAYGQASSPELPFYLDQLPEFARKRWLPLPFRSVDVQRQQIGPTIRMEALQ